MKELKELQRMEDANLGARLNLKNYRTLHGNNGTNKSNVHNGASNKSSNGNCKRNNSVTGSNRSLNSQNSSNSKLNEKESISQSYCNGKTPDTSELTWIHELFQGILVNETKCLNCETSSSKEENFLDLSVDVEQNTSINHCLQEFSNMEMLCGECKYYCENCSSKQEAEKRMRIKKLPKLLALHLKRFKFVGSLNKFVKLTYRVVFPFELRLLNTVTK
jgi:ubiquitin C-terminal hydrolase